jgi:hypothetical protein
MYVAAGRNKGVESSCRTFPGEVGDPTLADLSRVVKAIAPFGGRRFG